MTLVALQVRLDSARLPRKALLPLGGKRMVELVMEALLKIPADYHLIVTTEQDYKIFKEIGDPYGYLVETGPTDDVLQRFVKVINKYKADTIVRATGDNPLTSGNMAAKALSEYRKEPCDYFGFTGIPIGTAIEVVNCRALLRAERETLNPYDSFSREHVCPYLYNNRDKFDIRLARAAEPLCYDNYRVTVDSTEDYTLMTQIFNDLYKGSPIELETLVPYLKQSTAPNASVVV